jgi:hypothetical protein
MMLRTHRRALNRPAAGARGYLRSAAAYRRAGVRTGTSRLLAACGVRRVWWHRLADDRELVGAKLLLLAALLALTAALERVV